MKVVVDDLRMIGDVFFKIPPHIAIEKRKTSPFEKKAIDIGQGKAILYPMDFDSYKDVAAGLQIARDAETIILPDSLIRTFLQMAYEGKIEFVRELMPPFPHTAIQFNMIPEAEFFPSVEKTDFDEVWAGASDNVSVLTISRDLHPDTNKWLITVMAWFMPSMSVTRMAWWEASGLYNTQDNQELNENKLHLRAVCTAIVMYLNAQNVEIRRRVAPEKINKKRRKRGKRELPPYYETVITKTFTPATGAKGVGSKHSFMYPVRGHFRRYRNGERVWIGPHYRGVEHGVESMPKHAYRVKHGKEDD
jgi:hypothetical protein